MTGTVTTEATAAPRTMSKSATVERLLSRARGATLAELTAVTSWQPHSVRAFLTGLRKKGRSLLKEARKSGDTSYRLTA